jgi:hypothetical protein
MERSTMLLMGIQYSSTISMAMCNSYVCLPEGIAYPHIPMFNQGKIIEVSMVDPWPIKPKKKRTRPRAHGHTRSESEYVGKYHILSNPG